LPPPCSSNRIGELICLDHLYCNQTSGLISS
jgi:hypothetical protein